MGNLTLQEQQQLKIINLPGQIFSERNSNEIVLSNQYKNYDFSNSAGNDFVEDETSDSFTNFDIDAFRESKLHPQKSIELQAEKNNNNNEHKILKFLGVRFEIEVLQERNKEPLLFIKCLFFTTLIFYFIFAITFIVGLKFRLIPFCLYIGNLFSSVILLTSICQKSIKNKLGIDLKLFFFMSVAGTQYILLFIYAYLVKMPFNSIPFFVLIVYLQLLVFGFLAALLLTPNRTPFNDPNYQLKFFAPRIMAGFFNGTGVFDALSDIVLGIQLIQQPSIKFLIIGIFLFILCNADYFQVIRRVLTPEKISLQEQMYIVFIEVIVMALTTIVLLDASKISQGDENEDFLFVTVISITTTIVNFLHNLVLVFSTFFSFGENKFFV